LFFRQDASGKRGEKVGLKTAQSGRYCLIIHYQKRKMMEPWHWLVFGMLLIILELLVTSFTIIWFGCGAVLVAAAAWLLPGMGIGLQIFFWALASVFFTVIWFRVFKPRMKDKTAAGRSLEAVLGESGLVTRVPHGSSRGTVKFTTPLLGSEEWQFISNDAVAVGDRVTVVDVSGNTLIVKNTNQ
jgi:membrane protein implicated in regulation of membrane protease activity